MKRKVQNLVQAQVNEFWKEKVGSYIMQGDFLSLLMEEKGCITWRSFLWDLPKGVLKFALNAGINTLPTCDNLKRWGKRVNDRCPLCGNTQTLLHVLSNCGTALDQGRYTWRHDSVLLSIIESIRNDLSDGFVLYSDLPNFQAAHGGTIPPHILTTNLRPDMFIVNETSRIAIIFELTCPWDGNVSRSHTMKQEKYASLVNDLARDFRVFQFSFEVSVRGQVTCDNRIRLRDFIFRSCGRGVSSKKICLAISRAALLTSFSIFSARKEPSWLSPTPLIVK